MSFFSRGYRSCIHAVLAMAAMLTAQAAPAVMPRQATLAETQPSIEPTLNLAAWRSMPLGVLATELSPATLLSAQTQELGLFRNMAAWGQGAPTRLAMATNASVKVFAADSLIDATMSEAWLLVWFADAKGWERWDAPVLIVLEHKPTALHLDAHGLTLNFGDKPAGLVAMMPLWGYDKIALSPEGDFRKQHDLPSRGLYTRQWSESLPDEVAQRCRYFASVLRQFPVHVRETFALDGDALVVRSVFTWLTIDDDWKTPPLKLAPLPPTLGLAWWSGMHVAGKPFPMRISAPIIDPDVMTSYGPWLGVEGQDGYEVRFDVLSYVRQTVGDPDVGKLETDPLLRPVLDRLRQAMAEKFKGESWQEIWDHEVERSYGGPGLYCWQAMNDRWYGLAQPFVDDEVRRKMRAVLDGYLRSWVLDITKYTPFQGMLLLVGPGIATWGGFDDAGKFSTNLLDTIWHLAYFADDWSALEGRWPMLQKFFVTPLECDWKSVGRYGIAEMGDEAAPALAYARLAWHFGDMDQYAWGCYIFARELVHHYVKQVGAEYFRGHQPYQSMEPMRGTVWLTNLWGDVIGWQIDGPAYPEQTGERQSNNRWVRFSSFDVARFYRDVLPKEVRAELDDLTQRAREANDQAVFYKIHSDSAHIAPSLLRLRAMLTDDTPRELLALAPLENWDIYRAADYAAMTISVLRAEPPPPTPYPVPHTLLELIPPLRTNEVLGLERLGLLDPSASLVLAVREPDPVRVYKAMRHWPALTWHSWPSPMPAKSWRQGSWWSFGQVIPAGVEARNLVSERLNWNTRLWWLDPATQAETTPAGNPADDD